MGSILGLVPISADSLQNRHRKGLGGFHLLNAFSDINVWTINPSSKIFSHAWRLDERLKVDGPAVDSIRAGIAIKVSAPAHIELNDFHVALLDDSSE